MDRTRFRLQAVIILALGALVSWPQMRTVRATSIWLAPPAQTTQEETVQDRRFDYGEENKRARVGYGSLARTDNQDRERIRTNAPRAITDTPATNFNPPAEAVALGARVNAIVGRARTNLNAPIPYARILLRNMATGQIESRAVADAEGRFTFIDVGASGYIVELVGPDGAVIASSEHVAIEHGEMKEATVRVSGAESARALQGNTPPNATGATDPVQVAVQSGVNNTTSPEFCASAGPC